MILKKYSDFFEKSEFHQKITDEEIFLKYGAKHDKDYKGNLDVKYYRIYQNTEYHRAFFPDHEIPFYFSQSETLNISNCGLTTLQGSPEYVDGTFDCSNNDISSLEGAPKRIKKHFKCTDNLKLTNLDNFPNVGEFITFSRCGLTSLEGLPKIVKDDLYLDENKITDLKGCPYMIKGAFKLNGNLKLTSLEGGPIDVVGNYDLSNCTNLKSLYGITFNILDGILKVPDHLAVEGNFVNENRMNKEITKENYFIKLLEYVINNNKDIDKVNWPDGFLNDNLKRSVRSVSKFKL